MRRISCLFEEDLAPGRVVTELLVWKMIISKGRERNFPAIWQAFL